MRTQTLIAPARGGRTVATRAPLFSWGAYIVAAWVGTITGGLAWGLGPALLDMLGSLLSGAAAAGLSERAFEGLAGFGALILVYGTALAAVIALFLAPVALPAIAAMRDRGLLRRRHAMLGGMALAAVPAFVLALLTATGERAVPEAVPVLEAVLGMAGHVVALVIVPGALGGLTYRAIALRGGPPSRAS